MLPILIVDDSKEDLLLAERSLRTSGIENFIQSMTSGQECIRYFERHSKPALVLLDLAMVPLTGIDVLRALEQNPAARASIFIMLSGRADQKMLREGYQLGARTFLMKPLNSEEIRRLLDAFPDRIHLTNSRSGYILEWTTAPSPVRKEF